MGQEYVDFLGGLSRSRARQGFSPTETATFIFSFKQPLFEKLRKELESDPEELADEIWTASALLDKLGLFTTEAYQKTREEVIFRQQQELLELSTPVVVLWEGVLALPLIGTLDSARTQVVMESLLEKIVETGAGIAIIDITGVPDGGHAGGPAPAEDRGGRTVDGSRLHNQRHPPSDRANDRPSGRQSRRRNHQGHARRRLRYRFTAFGKLTSRRVENPKLRR